LPSIDPQQFFPEKDIDLLNNPVKRAAYSDRTAWIMAECSRLAYVENKSQLKKALAAGDLKLIKDFSLNEMTAYVALSKKHKYAVLAFKGTVPQELKTVLADLNFWWYKRNGVTYHEGFYKAYRSLLDDITAALRGIDLPIYVTGHSLGGAMATVCVMNYPDVDKMAACYTFGAPRICDLAGVIEFYKVPVYRMVHSDDVVPAVPFFSMGFAQIGDFRYIHELSTVIEGTAGYWVRKAFQLWCLLSLQWGRLIGDHSIEKYGAILLEVARRRNRKHRAAK